MKKYLLACLLMAFSFSTGFAQQAGDMFKDFSATYDGKTTKFSDYVGKGKYVLVDFWASWCPPCRREIPNLINVYNKYKGEHFTVLGVATWDEPDDTRTAITELGINYPQMLNAKKAGSDAYGIQGIPEIILFAPDGRIVARGLRGEEIEKAVSGAIATAKKNGKSVPAAKVTPAPKKSPFKKPAAKK